MPDVRKPWGAVKLAGTQVPLWESLEVENNVFRSADTFRCVFPMSQLPATRNLAWLSSQKVLEVEIFAGVDSSPSLLDSNRLILGNADEIRYQADEAIVEISGRDLTAVLIDTRTSAHFANQTASQIVKTVAGWHGLHPIVTATTRKAGQYYEIDHTNLDQEQSEWELLSKLADLEGMALFVEGHNLHFQPKAASSAAYALAWHPPTDQQPHSVSNTIALSLTRNLTIAKGIAVEVRSWNAKQKKPVVGTWPSRAVKSVNVGKSASPQIYRYTIAGLNPDQAVARAKAYYDQIVAHMVTLEATLPGDASLDCSKTLTLSGTGTTFDQTYYPDSVKRSLSVGEGYSMTVTAKNIASDVADAAQ